LARQFEGLVAGISRDGLAMFAENWKLKQEIESLKRELDLKDKELEGKDEKIAELNLALKRSRKSPPVSEASFDPDGSGGEEY